MGKNRARERRGVGWERRVRNTQRARPREKETHKEKQGVYI